MTIFIRAKPKKSDGQVIIDKYRVIGSMHGPISVIAEYVKCCYVRCT